MQNPRYQKAFYQEYYNYLYRKIAFGDIKPSQIYLAQQKKRGQSVLEWAKKNRVKTGYMLDHGCASGATMIAWQKLGWKTYGIDPHRPSIELAKKIGLDAEIATGEKLPFSNNKFDLVLSLGSLEHAYDLKKTFLELSRVIKENGFLLIRWRSDKIFGSPLEYYNHNHYRFFTPKTLKILLYKYGFEIKTKSNKKIEGWDSYSYILCKNKKNIKKKSYMEKIIRKELPTQLNLEMNKIHQTRISYYKKCLQFLSFIEKNNHNYDKIYDAIKKNKNIKWGFLGGTSKFKIKRSILEAKSYIKRYKLNMVK
jgi:ubiquinone/menaquinone biosynthesis C-methylase UbiE